MIIILKSKKGLKNKWFIINIDGVNQCFVKKLKPLTWQWSMKLENQWIIKQLRKVWERNFITLI